MARRRIERLQGVQFCRRTMEIRSEVSGPPDCIRGAWTEKEAFLRLLIFGSGGLGLGVKALGIFSMHSLRTAAQAPAGSARTRQGT